MGGKNVRETVRLGTNCPGNDSREISWRVSLEMSRKGNVQGGNVQMKLSGKSVLGDFSGNVRVEPELIIHVNTK